MNNLKKRIQHSEFLQNVLTLSTGATIAQMLPVLIAPVLTRLYSPDDFGLLALFTSIVTILSAMVSGKYELGTLLPKQNIWALHLTRLAVLLSIFGSILFLLFIFWGRRPVLSALNGNDIGAWLYLIPAAVLFTGVFEALRYYSIRKKKYRALSEAAIVRSGALSLFQAGAGFLGLGPGGLLWGYLISLLSGNLRLWNIFKKDCKKESVHLLEKKHLKKVAGRYAAFPKFTMPSLLLNTASVQLPIFVFSTFFSGAIVGFYSLAQRVLNAPMTLVGNAIGQVYFQKAAECKNDTDQLRTITWGLYRTLLWIGIFPISALFFFGRPLFGFVFGKDWTVAGHYAELLSLWILFVFISAPISNLFFIQEKQRQGLLLQGIMFSSRFVVLLTCVLLHFNAVNTVLAFGITGAVLFFCFIGYLLASLGVSRLKVFFYTLFVICCGMIPFYLIKQAL